MKPILWVAVCEMLYCTYFGSGKVDDIRQLADVREASTVIINDELSPSQLRNLDIFAEQALIELTFADIYAIHFLCPRL